MNSVQPLGPRVLVEQVKAEEKTKGGILLPNATAEAERPRHGTVIALGTGLRLEDGTRRPFEVEPGQSVVFRQYGGVPVKLDGKEYLILTEDEIVGILDPT